MSAASAHVFLQHAREIAGVLDGGRGIEVAADILDGRGDLRARCAILVPLKAMCSSTCEMPCSAAVSLREPALTQMPRDALSRCGMSSVRTVMPLSGSWIVRSNRLLPARDRCSNEGFDVTLVVGENVEALLPLVKIRQPRRKGRFNTRGGFDRSGELGGMRGGERHDRGIAAVRACGRQRRRPRCADRADSPTRLCTAAMVADVSASLARPAAKACADGGEAPWAGR